MKDKLLWFGSLLALTGLLGLTTVADEFRHLNELIAVCAILVTGVVLIVISMRSKRLDVPMPSDKVLWVGASLTLLGILGFGFVADDFEHMTEVYVCSAVLLAGVALLIFGWRRQRFPSVH